MTDNEMLTTIDGPTLAAAFPVEHRASATLAGMDVSRRLAPRQWTERFAVQVGRETVLIPARLHLASHRPSLAEDVDAWLFARALQTRSNDGYERQRALRDLLADAQPWTAPFIVALIGEYVVELLYDISAAMTPEIEQTIGTFIVHNPNYWNTIKRRVTSYWNVYYRARWLGGLDRAERRDEHVGFRLTQQIEVAAHRCVPTADE